MQTIVIHRNGTVRCFFIDAGTLRLHVDGSFSLKLCNEHAVFEIVENPLHLKAPRPADIVDRELTILHDPEEPAAYADVFGKEWWLATNCFRFSRDLDPARVHLDWTGRGCLLADEASDEFSFVVRTSLRFVPGYWQCDYESVGELYVESLYSNDNRGDDDRFLDFVKRRIHSSSVSVTLFDGGDESVMRCLGNATERIIECGFWDKGAYCYRAVRKPGAGTANTTISCGDTDNDGVVVSVEEVLCADQVVELFTFFLYAKELPAGYEYFEKQHYLFR